MKENKRQAKKMNTNADKNIKILNRIFKSRNSKEKVGRLKYKKKKKKITGRK